MNYDAEKFKAAVHYVCSATPNPAKLNTTKLHKILWLADILAFKNFGMPITAETYKKNTHGPYSTHLTSVIDELKKEGRLQVREVAWDTGKFRREMIASGKINKDLFSAAELRLIEEMRSYVCDDHTAQSVSAITHDHLWQMAAMHEAIPYTAILAVDLVPVSKEDLEWAQNELKGGELDDPAPRR